MRKWWLRLAMLALLVVGQTLSFGPPAHAAGGVTAIVHDAGTGSAWVEVRVTAAAGEDNRITVRTVGSQIRISDVGDTLDAGVGCSQVSARAVDCASVGRVLVKVDARDQDDFIHVRADVRTELDGGSGDDTLLGGPAGNRMTGGTGDDLLVGGEGWDIAVALATPDGADAFYGGGSVDTADYSRRAGPVDVSLDGVANDGAPGEGDNIATTVGEIYGGSGDDTFSAHGEYGVVLHGFAGDDTLIGGGGGDHLWGGSGDDTLIGGGGNDNVFGDDGDDTALALSDADGSDLFFGGDGLDTAHYGRRSDTVYVSLDRVANDGAPGKEKDNNAEDVESIVGGSGDDVLTGSAADNMVWGLAGDDELTGGGGNDSLFGGDGTDTCRSDPGDARTGCEA